MVTAWLNTTDHVGQLLKISSMKKASPTTLSSSIPLTTARKFSVGPTAAPSQFRGEKNTTWEGGFRVPMMVRWTGRIKPAQVSNEIISMEDWMPTLLAVAGDPGIREKLLRGHKAGDRTFKVHLDGYNFLPYFTGEAKEGPRREMFYFTDDGSLSALRYRDWKVMFSEQRAHGFDVWQEQLALLRLPKIFNLRRDPFERADHETFGYAKWRLDRTFALVPAQSFVAGFLSTFKEFPPRQKPASFTIDQVLETLQEGSTN